MDIVNFWKGFGSRFPKLHQGTVKFMWYPVGSVDVERSFSVYKNLLTDKRQGLSESSTKSLVAMYFNGDIVGRWEGYR